MRFQERIESPNDSRYYVELDSDQVYPDDPGNGTPAMVYGPGGVSATLWCAADTGELLGGSETHDIPQRVLDWLQAEANDRANDFIAAVTLHRQPPSMRDLKEVSRLVQFWTAFGSLDELLKASGGYRPSLDQREVVMAVIADTYDFEQARRNDPRRAYRYGVQSTAA